MAQISFDVASQMEADRAQSSNSNSFDFFTLRNDGDEAIVRFAYNDTSTFKIYTVHDIELMRKTVGPDMGVKASGGIRTHEDLVKMVEAGATRIGTSSGPKII